ncbi:deaminase domain-containing protein [Pseudomonas sp. NPDC089734]|uniref:deaminase domain-containing protein n=1 Tax=Pseudomonas sp. NPDC089734 TaxID=3364469 RepID=UPI00380C4C0B
MADSPELIRHINNLTLQDLCLPNEFTGTVYSPVESLSDLFRKCLGIQASDRIRKIDFDPDYLEHLEQRVKTPTVEKRVSGMLYNGDEKHPVPPGGRLAFFRKMCRLALDDFKSRNPGKLSDPSTLTPGHAIFSLAGELWSSGACAYREQAFWFAGFILYPDLKKAATPGRPEQLFPLPPLMMLPNDQDLGATLARLLADQPGTTVLEKLTRHLNLDVMHLDSGHFRPLTPNEASALDAPPARLHTKDLVRGVILDRPPKAALNALMNSRAFKALAARLAEALGWSPLVSPPETVTTPSQRLLLEALMDVFYPPRDRRMNFILHYSLFDKGNDDLSFAEIRIDLDNATRDTLKCALADAQLVNELLLHRFAPELLLTDVPADFRYQATPRWVNLRHGLALCDPTRAPDFEALEALPMERTKAALTEQEKTDIVSLLNDAILAWANHEAIIPSKSSYTITDIYRATRAFMLLCDRHLLQLVPNRAYAAQRTLLAAGIDPGAQVQDQVIRIAYSELESYLDDGSHYRHAKLANTPLPDITRQFHDDFDRYLKEAETILSRATRMFLHDLPAEDKKRLLDGKLKLYATSWKEYIGPDHPHQAQESDWRYRRGNLGCLIHAHYQDEHFIYEVFPLENRFLCHRLSPKDVAIITNPDLFQSVMYGVASLEYSSYNHGPDTYPGFPRLNYLETVRGPTVEDKIARCMTHDIFLFHKEIIRENCMGLTTAESRRKKRTEAPFEAIWQDIKNIVPFVGCFDVNDGADAASCLLDVVPELGRPLATASRTVASTLRVANTVGKKRLLMPIMASRLFMQGVHHSASELKALARRFVNTRTSIPAYRASLLHSTQPSSTWRPATPMDRLTQVDGVSNIAIRNTGTLQNPDYRQIDLHTGNTYGPRLVPFASPHDPAGEPIYLSMRETIVPGQYPGCAPVQRTADDACGVRIAANCEVYTLYREQGLVDIRIDNVIYRLDTSQDTPFLRRLDLDTSDYRTQQLLESPGHCRPKRDLLQTCTAPLSLKTKPPEVNLDAGSSRQQQAAVAFSLREYRPAEMLVELPGSAPRLLPVMVMEGHFQKWADHIVPAKGRKPEQVIGKKLSVLTPEEKAALNLPDKPVYQEQITGTLLPRHPLPENASDNVMNWIDRLLPAMEFKQIAEGIEDSRVLRGVKVGDDIMVEPDHGVFYRAALGQGDTLLFSRVTNPAVIKAYLIPSEHMRFLANRFHAKQDIDNVAKLLFDMQQHTGRRYGDISYAQYLQRYQRRRLCTELEEEAVLILSGAAEQEQYVEMARSLIPDFKKISLQPEARQAAICEVLNHLLPARNKQLSSPGFNLETIVQISSANEISRHINLSNLAYVAVETPSGARMVIYALAGGKRAKKIHLKIEEPRKTIGGVTYIDARAVMQTRAPDPKYTSLPTLRRENTLVVRQHDRQLDSERLIATVMDDELVHDNAARIHFFTLMDSCGSCGGFVLPRVRLNYPNAEFSVTYMLDYP